MNFASILETYGLSSQPGHKTKGFISVPGTPVKMPVTFIAGKQPGKQVLLTGGVHGGEYPCIETAIRLASQLKPTEITGTLLIIHPVNTPAFMAKLQYYGPYDGKNLNRVFPGKALGTVSERIAYTVHQFQKCADFYIDLHGGDIHESLVPFAIYSHLGPDGNSELSMQASAALGFPYVVGSYSETGSVGAAAVAGIPGFLTELGQCGRWSEEEVSTYIAAVRNVLCYLGLLVGKVEDNQEVIFIEKMTVINASHEGCWYPLKTLESKVVKGEKIGEIRDFFGECLSEYFAEIDGIILYVVTSLAINKGDPLLAIG